MRKINSQFKVLLCILALTALAAFAYGRFPSPASSLNVADSGDHGFWVNSLGVTVAYVDQSGNVFANDLIPATKWVTNSYAVQTNDTVLFCWGTNQVLTLPTAPQTGKMFTVFCKNPNGSVTITNGNGSQTLIVPGVGQGLAAYLGAATSPSNTITVTFDGSNY